MKHDEDRPIGIKVEGVSKRFEDFLALDDVTLDVPEGSLTALLGPSGSGKSTMLRLIAGLEQADTGRVFLEGRELPGVKVLLDKPKPKKEPAAPKPKAKAKPAQQGVRHWEWK